MFDRFIAIHIANGFGAAASSTRGSKPVNLSRASEDCFKRITKAPADAALIAKNLAINLDHVGSHTGRSFSAYAFNDFNFVHRTVPDLSPKLAVDEHHELALPVRVQHHMGVQPARGTMVVFEPQPRGRTCLVATFVDTGSMTVENN